MSYDYVYKNDYLYCDEFQQALALFEKNRLTEAAHLFQLAYESVNRSDIYHNKYASFCGLVRAMQSDYGGLTLCRDAARSERFDGDVYLNLARAELIQKSRKKAVTAILKGLSIDDTHPGLHRMQMQLGIRKHNPIPLLSRKSFLNCLIGKILRKKDRPECEWLLGIPHKAGKK